MSIEKTHIEELTKMSMGKTRIEGLTEILKKYQIRYQPNYISLISKDEFLDIINLEHPSSTIENRSEHHTINTEITEEDFYRFKDLMVRGFSALDFEIFISKYFQEKDNYDFETKCNDNVCALVWWIKRKNSKNGFFDTSGAAMIRDMVDYWVIILFSNTLDYRKTYEAEMNSLGSIIEKLDDMDRL